MLTLSTHYPNQWPILKGHIFQSNFVTAHENVETAFAEDEI
jgi:hypothetical protein